MFIGGSFRVVFSAGPLRAAAPRQSLLYAKAQSSDKRTSTGPCRDEGPHHFGLSEASHTFTVPSLLPEAMRLLSAENATLMTALVCPLRARRSCPGCASHTLTAWSLLTETM